MFESDGVEEGMESEARLIGGLGAEYVGGLLFGDGETESSSEKKSDENSEEKPDEAPAEEENSETNKGKRI